MANEIEYIHDTTGVTTLVCILGDSSGRRWNTATPGWETLTVANIADYQIALTESPASSYRYVADLPNGVSAATAWVYDNVGVDLTAADQPNFLAAGVVPEGTVTGGTVDSVTDPVVGGPAISVEMSEIVGQ